MTHLIKRIIDLTVGRLMDLISNDNRRIDQVLHAASDQIAQTLTANTSSIRKLAQEIDVNAVAECISTEDVAGAIDAYDIVNNLDMSEVAEHIDMNELAEHVQRLMPEPKASPAPEEVLVSDSSMVERLLEKAAQMLLEQAERAVKNGEV